MEIPGRYHFRPRNSQTNTPFRSNRQPAPAIAPRTPAPPRLGRRPSAPITITEDDSNDELSSISSFSSPREYHIAPEPPMSISSGLSVGHGAFDGRVMRHLSHSPEDDHQPKTPSVSSRSSRALTGPPGTPTFIQFQETQRARRFTFGGLIKTLFYSYLAFAVFVNVTWLVPKSHSPGYGVEVVTLDVFSRGPQPYREIQPHASRARVRDRPSALSEQVEYPVWIQVPRNR